MQVPEVLQCGVARLPWKSIVVLLAFCAAALAGDSSPGLARGYGKVSLAFETNRGQTDPRVQFLSRGPGYTLFLTSGEAVLKLSASRAKRRAGPERFGLGKPSREEAPAVLRLRLLRANPSPTVTGQEQLPGRSNYFRGNDPRKWRMNVPSYERVCYAGIYPGIDLVYYGNPRRLEHDFVVAPGAEPSAIAFAVRGAERQHIAANGDLVLRVRGGEVRLQRPILYQEVEGTRREVAGSYRIRRTGEIGFAVGSYDRQRTLVIDPVLSYSTYLGGSDYDLGQAIAADSSGNAYITGSAVSIDFPAQNPAQATFGGGGADVFVAKLNSSGSALLYSTYLGGSGFESGQGIAVDGSGNAYVTGYTLSTDFPTHNPLQAANGGGGGYDGFVVKLDATGALAYSTYLGGSGTDVALRVTANAAGNAYVTGYTSSSNFPTQNAVQPAWAGSLDSFVTVLNPAGGAMLFSTYLGGGNLDIGLGVAVDLSDNVYLTGATFSTDFPTGGALQPALAGSSDGYVTKLDPTGGAILYSTYLGGTLAEEGTSIAVDSSGNAYMTGSTASSDYPVVNALQPTYGGGPYDAIVSKINSTGSALVYSTNLGGNDIDEGSGIRVDSADNAWVSGSTTSTNFPTQSPVQAALAGVLDAVVVKLNPAGSALVFSTFLGGNGTGPADPECLHQTGCDAGQDLAVDSQGSAYLVGYTSSADFHTQSPLQASLNGSYDVLVAKIVEPDFTLSVNGPATVNAGMTASYTLTVTPSPAPLNSPVNGFTCTGLPAGTACGFNPATVTPGNNPATTMLTITTTAPTLASAPSHDSPALALGMWSSTGLLGLVGIIVLPDRRQRRAGIPVLLLALLVAITVSCGGGGESSASNPTPRGGTPAGTYMIPVSATGNGTTHTLSVTLTVR